MFDKIIDVGVYTRLVGAHRCRGVSEELNFAKIICKVSSALYHVPCKRTTAVKYVSIRSKINILL